MVKKTKKSPYLSAQVIRNKYVEKDYWGDEDDDARVILKGMRMAHYRVACCALTEITDFDDLELGITKKDKESYFHHFPKHFLPTSAAYATLVEQKGTVKNQQAHIDLLKRHGWKEIDRFPSNDGERTIVMLSIKKQD